MDETTVSEPRQDIELQIKQLQIEQETLFEDMSVMLNQKRPQTNKQISKLIPTLKLVRHDSDALVTTMDEISSSAEKISGKIRQFDAAKSRVQICQNRVNDLLDLEMAANGVRRAIEEGGYERGAAHVHRFLSMDREALEGTANAVQGAAEVRDAVRALEEGAEHLKTCVRRSFSDALRNENLAEIERFFKVFPMLGMHEEGVREFCQFLRRKISATAEKNLAIANKTPSGDKRYGVIYADTLTLLFEGVARTIDTHHPLVETFYGPGRLFSAIEILQIETDVQMKKILMDWSRARQINKKIQNITEVMSNSGSLLGTGSTAGPNSSSGSGGSRLGHQRGNSGIERFDPKELDILIYEITQMHSRTELYCKFVQKKVMSDISGIEDTEQKTKILNSLENLLKNSDLTLNKHELLSYYLRFEQYFMQESFLKAISLDLIEPEQKISSMVDDTFFIIKKCIRRSISSNSLDGVCAIINNACEVLERDFCDAFRARLKSGYPSGYLDLTQAYNVLQTSIQQGRLQSGDTEQARTLFIITLNNVDKSSEYIETLCDTSLKEIAAAFEKNMNQSERGKLESCLSGISIVTSNLREILEQGLQQLRGSAIKPRIHPLIDNFLNINYQLNEEELSVYEAGESFVQTLIMGLDPFISSFKEILSANNFDGFVETVTVELTQRWEKNILKSSFNRLGGLMLDKEVRSLSGYLTTNTSWSVREKFTRLTQIATILNLEQPNEIFDYYYGGDYENLKLTPSEIRSIMALRSDFKIEMIKSLKL